MINIVKAVNWKKAGVLLLEGALPAVGGAVINECYKMYTAVDPTWDLRFKLGAKKRQKQFNNIMKQTNLKEELA